ncbi:MAG TPA: twin-arginine translocation signal domain-containing protein [Chloroflexota bacterium]|nr:twin-arginine translocation signal domain-containing protein [Chloroflexota bacterium]
MAKLTRRDLIKQTSAGAAALGALAAVPGLAGAQGAPQAHAAGLSAADRNGPLVAYLRDEAVGEIGLLVGTREIIVRDRELVQRLLTAAQ